MSTSERLTKLLHSDQAGAAAMLVAALVALVWANSPGHAGYESLWSADVARHADVRAVVNEGLMTLFFLVVGLEIKRELVTGELREWRTAALPVFAAVGGMVVPAGIYLVVAGGAGWAVPIATDIAFAVGVLAILGDRVPASLRLFLLSLAVVDDIGAIVVIAVFYSEAVHGTALAVAALLLAGVLALRKAGVTWVPVYVVVGTAVWLALFESGVQAAITGAMLGLMAPATVAEEMEERLKPLVGFVVLPLFALANAGVAVDGRLFDTPGAPAVAAGVVLGLVVGKALGISTFSWLAVRAGLGSLPNGVTWSQVVGIGVTAGIGFTVSLLVAELAFVSAGLERAAKVAVLVASATDAPILAPAFFAENSLGWPPP